MNNPCKYKWGFFPDETVSFSDYLTQLVSPNLTFHHNLFSQGQILKGCLYLSAVLVSDGISKAGGGGKNHIFFQFWQLLFPNYQAVFRQTLLQAAGFLGLLRTAKAKRQQEVCEQLIAVVAEHAACVC